MSCYLARLTQGRCPVASLTVCSFDSLLSGMTIARGLSYIQSICNLSLSHGSLLCHINVLTSLDVLKSFSLNPASLYVCPPFHNQAPWESCFCFYFLISHSPSAYHNLAYVLTTQSTPLLAGSMQSLTFKYWGLLTWNSCLSWGFMITLSWFAFFFLGYLFSIPLLVWSSNSSPYSFHVTPSTFPHPLLYLTTSSV